MSAPADDRINTAFVAKRRVAVPGADGAEALEAIRERLESCPGVMAVHRDGRRCRVRLTYDASQVGFDHLVSELAAAGYPVAGGVWSRLKRQWFSYLDDNARANAGGGKGACCSQPSDIYAARSRKR
ncbi:MAG TPA: heavy-metal-associated domain-containing protein [Gammaproteobacteria bacterium]|nr:heavy-metal-associated domain-containing protein [Gammaproteobacteria bacterium]